MTTKRFFLSHYEMNIRGIEIGDIVRERSDGSAWKVTAFESAGDKDGANVVVETLRLKSAASPNARSVTKIASAVSEDPEWNEA